MSWLAIDRAIIESDLRALEDHLPHLESLFRSRLNAFEKPLFEMAKAIPDDRERDDFFEWHSDEYWQLTERLPNLQRSALLAILYGFFESRLDSICHSLGTGNGPALSLGDVAEKGVRRARRYLSKVASFELPRMDKDWEEILYVSDLRNTIMHSGGRLDTPSKNLLAYVGRQAGLSVGPSGVLMVEVEFLRHVILLVRENLLSVIDEAVASKQSRHAPNSRPEGP